MAITVLAHPDDITTMHTLYPILTSRFRRHFVITADTAQVLDRPRGNVVCVARLFRLANGPAARKDLLERLRRRYKRLIILDNTASPGQVSPFGFSLCDLYYKSSIYRDRTLYNSPVATGRLFIQHYVDQGLLENPEAHTSETYRVDGNPNKKLHLLWNIGLGSYPRTKMRRALARRVVKYTGISAVRHVYPSRSRMLRFSQTTSGERDAVISSRFSTNFDVPGIQAHRTLFSRNACKDPRFRCGRIPQHEYNRELSRALATLSPFGYGEVCLRDFEAVINGSVLIKPDMSHLETWPDIYRAGETYLPCAWDASDLSAVADRLWDDPNHADQLARSARDALAHAYMAIDRRVEAFIDEISSET